MNFRQITITRMKALARHKLLLWATFISLIAGVVEFGAPLDQVMRIVRNKLLTHPASGEIVIAGIDDYSVQRLGKWPRHEGHYARVVERLDALGARRIFLNVDLSAYPGTNDARRLERALAQSRAQIVLQTRFVMDPIANRRSDILPHPRFARHATLANANAWNDALLGVRQLPYSSTLAGRTVPSLAAALGDQIGHAPGDFPIDYAIDWRSIPVVDAAAVIEGGIARNAVSGKDVIVSTTSRQFGDSYLIPGRGLTPSVFAHVLGGETLRRGDPRTMSWLPPLLLAFAVALIATLWRRATTRILLPVAIAVLLVAPLAFEASLIFVEVVPAIMLLAIVCGGRAWARWRTKTVGTNPISGLPNLNALRHEEWAHNTALVAARVQNFAEITAALPQQLERTLVGQIVHRIGVGCDNVSIYQGEEGIFAWLVNKSASHSIGDELEALHALFRSPLVVEGRQIDLDISFGVEMSGDRRLANRLGSALVAADEACAEGRRWKAHDPARLEGAEWRLSLLSRLDTAIDSGEIWVAFQPKLDLTTKRICGAEALARWTHPDKGEISPEDFVLAAEQHNRIEKLTAHVLNESMKAAAAINAQGVTFGVSVNLSARLLDNPSIVSTIGGLLSRHKLPPELLTLEVTESAAINSDSSPLDALKKLRLLGLNISLDDYGTGFSTLEYLKKVPANEIKIDKSFVGAMHNSRSDAVMVRSTIDLAHSLDRRVVAEGVERIETLDALAVAGCDVAQGYLIGRPMPLHQLLPWLLSEQTRMVA